jgi:hypothetical protein
MGQAGVTMGLHTWKSRGATERWLWNGPGSAKRQDECRIAPARGCRGSFSPSPRNPDESVRFALPAVSAIEISLVSAMFAPKADRAFSDALSLARAVVEKFGS